MTYAGDRGPAAVDWFHPSVEGGLVAFGMSHRGSEQSVGSILDLRTREVLSDRLHGVRHASVVWLPDGSGFFYSHHPGNRAYGREIRLHRLGTPQADDPLVWASGETSLDWPDVELSPDGDRLLVHVSIGWSDTDVHLIDLSSGDTTAVVTNRGGKSRLHFTESGSIIGATSVGAPYGQVVRIDPGRHGWEVIVPESDVVIDDVSAGDGSLFVVGERDMSSVVGFLDLRADERMRFAPMRGPGHVASLSPTPGQSMMRNRVVRHLDRTTAVFSWSTPAHSPRLVGWDAANDTVCDIAAWDQADRLITVRRAAATASDGCEIPMIVLEPEDASPDARLPTLLHAYGGFGLSSTAAYSEVGRAWVDLGHRYVDALRDASRPGAGRPILLSVDEHGGTAPARRADGSCTSARPPSPSSCTPSERAERDPMETMLFIAGQTGPASGDRRFPVHDPATGAVLAHVADATDGDVNAAVGAAHAARESWCRTSAWQRYEVLRDGADALRRDVPAMAELISAETGKPVREALAEARNTARFFEWFSHETLRLPGESWPDITPSRDAVVVAAITPWNFPAFMVACNAGAALAAGCTVVLKPAEQTPLTALFIFNSLALDMLGVGDETPDAPGGRIERDPATGVATGRTYDMFAPLGGPQAPVGVLAAAMRRTEERYLAVGVTAVGDIQLHTHALDALIKNAEDTAARLRAVAYPKLPTVLGEADVRSGAIKDRFSGIDRERLSLGGIKIFLDGGLTAGAAALHDDYPERPGYRGELAYTDEDVRRLVALADENDLQIAMHAIGDRALDQAIAAVEALPADRRGVIRHRIEHAGNMFMTEERIKRIAEAAIVPVPQPAFLLTTATGYLAHLGAERIGTVMPFRTLIDSGLPVPGNSDAIGITADQHDPFPAMQAAVERRARGGEPLDEHEAV